MPKRIHSLKRFGCLLLCFTLLGCKTQTVEEVIEETPEEVLINKAWIQTKIQEVLSDAIKGNKNSMQENLARDVTFEDDITLFKGCSIDEENRLIEKEERYISDDILQCQENRYVFHTEWNQEGQIQSSYIQELLPEPTLEETDKYKEEIILIGNTPKLYGVLTLPKNVENPRVMIIMPSSIDENHDDTALHAGWKKSLAHDLANNGIASVRYDMRFTQTPKAFPGKETFDLDDLVYEDFAYLVHHLERYPVNADAITLIGEGVGGYLCFTSIYHHFEITGGMIMIDPPSDTGMKVLCYEYGLSEENIERVSKAITNKEVIPELIDGYSFLFWKQWNEMTPSKYISGVNQRVLVLNTKGVDTSWQTLLKNHSKSLVKGYRTINDFYTNQQFNTTMMVDLIDWMNGKDITKDVRRR